MIGAIIFKYIVIGIFVVIMLGKVYFFFFSNKGIDFSDKINELGDIQQQREKQLQKMEAEAKFAQKRRDAKRVLKVERRTYYDKMVMKRIEYQSSQQKRKDPTDYFFKYEKHGYEACKVNEKLMDWEIVHEEYFDAVGKKISSTMNAKMKEEFRHEARVNEDILESPLTFVWDEHFYKL